MKTASDATRLEAVYIDMGGTLETLVYDDAMRAAACERIQRVLREAGIAMPLTLIQFLDCVKSGLQRIHHEPKSPNASCHLPSFGETTSWFS